MLPYFQHWSNQAHPAQFQRLYAYRHRVWTKVLPSQHALDAVTGIVVNNLRRADIMKKESNSGISFFQCYLTVTCQTSIWGSCR